MTLRVVPQLQTTLPTKADDCGLAAEVVCETAWDPETYPHPRGKPARSARIKAARERSGVKKGPTNLIALERSFEALPQRTGFEPPKMNIKDDRSVTAFEAQLVPALERGNAIVLGVQYQVINDYHGGAISGQPGPPLDPEGFPCEGPHWVVIQGLVIKDGGRFTLMVDSLRDGRRNIPRGPVLIPLWLARKATALFNGNTSGIVAGIVAPLKITLPEPPVDLCEDDEPTDDDVDGTPKGGAK